MRDDLERHYRHLAATYDDTWGHRPDYVDWMAERIHARLDLRPDHWIGDIGAGTGLFLRRLMRYASPERPVVCVDPSPDMLERLPRDPRLHPVRATAEDIAEGRAALPCDRFDALLIKEAVHHFSELERTLAGLADRLAPGGRILIVTLPPKIDYPLFQTALDRFAAGQPEPDTVAAALRTAGLRTTVEYDAYTVRIERELWHRLVRNRWMSVLSSFSDEELAAGLAEMAERYPDEQLVFPDRFAFITGRREDAPTDG